MGIVGYGDIGAECAKIAKKGFKMRVIGIKRNPESVNDKSKKYADEILGNENLDYLLSQSDYVVNALPLVKDTIDLYNYEVFEKMKPSSIFINIGRG